MNKRTAIIREKRKQQERIDKFRKRRFKPVRSAKIEKGLLNEVYSIIYN